MMMELDAWLAGFGGVMILAVAGWLLSVRLIDVSIVDSMWSMLFVAVLGVYLYVADTAGSPMLISVLLLVWALRLGIYITWRNHGTGEDKRYQEIRSRNNPGFWLKSLWLIFGFQAVIAWLISIPLLVVAQSEPQIEWLLWLGALVWATGVFFESVSDWQLSRFKKDPRNRGKVMSSGLWRYSRHPNYFGNACVWWGFFLMAAACGGWWTVYSPILMTFLLLKISGVALLEQTIVDRRPAYCKYVETTNAFFPGPSRSNIELPIRGEL